MQTAHRAADELLSSMQGGEGEWGLGLKSIFTSWLSSIERPGKPCCWGGQTLDWHMVWERRIVQHARGPLRERKGARRGGGGERGGFQKFSLAPNSCHTSWLSVAKGAMPALPLGRADSQMAHRVAEAGLCSVHAPQAQGCRRCGMRRPAELGPTLLLDLLPLDTCKHVNALLTMLTEKCLTPISISLQPAPVGYLQACEGFVDDAA